MSMDTEQNLKEKLIKVMQNCKAYLALGLEVNLDILDDAVSKFAEALVKAGVNINDKDCSRSK